MPDILAPSTSPESSPSTSPEPSPAASPSISPSSTPIPRINKNHGFLRCIIQNQIERDEYHKAVAQTREDRDQQYQRNRIHQKVSQNRYIPPHLRSFVSQPVSTSSPQISSCDSSPITDPYHELRCKARQKVIKELKIN